MLTIRKLLSGSLIMILCKDPCHLSGAVRKYGTEGGGRDLTGHQNYWMAKVGLTNYFKS